MASNDIDSRVNAAAVRGERSISWQARWVEVLLRMMVKRRMPPDVDLTALRRHYEEVDRDKFRAPPDAVRTPVDAEECIVNGWMCRHRGRSGCCSTSTAAVSRCVCPICMRASPRGSGARSKRVLLVDYRLAPDIRTRPASTTVSPCTAGCWHRASHRATS